jgi:hypothetical protein
VLNLYQSSICWAGNGDGRRDNGLCGIRRNRRLSESFQ